MFEGVFCPTITITDDEGKIDFDLWGKHLDHLADAGMNGVLLFGRIGEFYSVSLDQKKEALKFAVDRVAGRMKVFAGVGDTTYSNVLDFTRYAEDVGADAVLVGRPLCIAAIGGLLWRYRQGDEAARDSLQFPGAYGYRS